MRRPKDKRGTLLTSLLLLIASLLGMAVVVAPVLSIIGFVRARAMQARLDALARTVEALERQVRTLSGPPPAQASGATGSVRAAEAQPSPTPHSPAVTSPGPAAPTTRTATPPPVPPVVRPAPRISSPPVLPPSPPQPRAAGPQPPPADPPGPPGPPGPAPAPAPAFDWESMLGIRGAAWLGGITLVIAALFFAKWSIDQGFFTPVIRLALLLLAGTAALAWAEVKLRQGYQTTANAVSGAGVVILYVAFYAGHALYQLVPLPVAFAGMSVVTVVAAVISVRYAALFTALIGLVGGLATPMLLSTGVDRPVAFFSYLLLLTAGFLHVAERQRWTAVTAVALVGTALLELAWFASYMSPEKLAVGATAFAAHGAVFVWHAVRTRETGPPLAHQAGLAGSLVPLGFGVLLAADPRLAAQWAGVTGFIAIVDLGLVLAALGWRQPVLVGVPAAATGLAMYVLGGTHASLAAGAWGLSGSMLALAAGFNLLPRLAPGRDAQWLQPGEPAALFAGAATLLGLLSFTWLTTEGGHLPTWTFLLLTAGCFAGAIERTRGGLWPGVFGASVVLIALSCSHWVTRVAAPGTFVDHLTIPHLFAVLVAVVAAWRAIRAGAPGPRAWWRTDHAAVMAAATVAYLGALDHVGADIAPAPVAYFALVAVDVALALGTALQAGWPGVVPVAAAASLVFSAAWHDRHFMPSTAGTSVAAYLTAYLAFLGLPFVATRWLAPSWKTRPAPWLASALMGPASFLLFYDSWVRLWGKAWVGVVPVSMAAISVAALYGIGRHFEASSEEAGARRRLNYLALFAAIALGFIATAVPLQLDRQWITIGWALEAVAVWWLFGMLPHPGLKYFGLGLFLAVATRLLANPEVLRYEPRGGPIVNWLLYTYGVPALSCLAGAFVLRRAEQGRGDSPAYDYMIKDREHPAPLVAFIGLLLVFWLINLEIADYYSIGRYVELDLSRHLARDLTRSFAWGLYALTLLGLGLWRASRGLRIVSMGFLLLTVAKVFLYDLGQLTGLYRIVSFLALGVSLIVVSLLYQRFVRRVEAQA
ncbi:MAG: DUF2339 domain-containing protein [Vicinamibacterales bacterium]